ncbi:unnamed protein product, partial [Adineta steineri]
INITAEPWSSIIYGNEDNEDQIELSINEFCTQKAVFNSLNELKRFLQHSENAREHKKYSE